MEASHLPDKAGGNGRSESRPFFDHFLSATTPINISTTNSTGAKL